MKNIDLLEKNDRLTKGQKTAIKIIEAAARCIAKIGAEKTSITAIAKEANLKRSIIAYHFPKKEMIFYQVMKHIMMNFGKNHLVEKLQKVSTNRESLEVLITTYLDYFYENPHYFRCYLHCFYLASFHEGYKQLNTNIFKRTVSRIAYTARKVAKEVGIVATVEDCESFAHIIYSNLLGIIMSYYTVDHSKSYKVYRNDCIELLQTEIDAFLIHTKNLQNTN